MDKSMNNHASKEQQPQQPNTPQKNDDNEEQNLCSQCGYDLSLMKLPPSSIFYCPQCQLPQVLVAGKYRLEKKLSEGGGGILYLARHISLKLEPYRVIKFLRLDISVDPLVERRFANEVEITSAISQKNNHIVRVYDDFGHIDKLGHYYVMEYLEGETLEKYLEKETERSYRDIFHIIRQIAFALREAHKANIVHRDLKPSNIFLINLDGDPLFVKVIDFGIAKNLNQQATLVTKGALGTPAYMSPEQCASLDIDHRSDLYSLCLIFFELIVGHSPFLYNTGTFPKNFMEALFMRANIMEAPPIDNFKTPFPLTPRLIKMFARCLLRSPELRFADMDALLHEMAQIEREIPQETFLKKHKVPRNQPQLLNDTGNDSSPQNEAPSSSNPLPTAQPVELPSSDSPTTTPPPSSQQPPPITTLPPNNEPSLTTTPPPVPIHEIADHRVFAPPYKRIALIISFSFLSLLTLLLIALLIFFRTHNPIAPHPNPPKNIPSSHPQNNTPTTPQKILAAPPRQEKKNNPSLPQYKKKKKNLRKKQKRYLRKKKYRKYHRKLRKYKKKMRRFHRKKRNSSPPLATRRISSPPPKQTTKTQRPKRPKKRTKGCPPDPTKGGYWIKLKISLQRAKLRTNYRTMRYPRWYCLLKDHRNLPVQISAYGYQECLFRFPRKKRYWTIRLKKISNDLDMDLTYCLQK